ncbi:hypothetical protein ZOSMA_303G00170 [Zostera marina]|uniref:Sorting nexin/Vps5-like C-terminal domain-containing protein n=1 Tax=Zostera marina TaxID=29655 RepID=A0A0K9PAH7_ZOSMR|nr:hypothetical protein ZOSMA_303G00170 [Zostera marina]
MFHASSIGASHAGALIKAKKDIGHTMGDLGLAFIKLTKFETEEAIHNSQKIRADETRCFGTAAVKACRFYRESNAQIEKHLDTLHEYLGLMMPVQTAFSDRSSALLTVQTLLSDLSSTQVKADKLENASSKIFGVDKSRIQKIEELKETVRSTEDAKNVAVREYERIKENIRNELERFDKERRRDFFGMMKAFITNKVEYAEKIASVWEKVAEDTNQYVKKSE